MKKVIVTLICGGALFICPTLSQAKPYDLSYCLVSKLQDRPRGSKSVKRPLAIDLTDRILTVPSQVEGYTLTLESEEGVVYTYYIIGGCNAIEPARLDGILLTNKQNKTFMH